MTGRLYSTHSLPHPGALFAYNMLHDHNICLHYVNTIDDYHI